MHMYSMNLDVKRVVKIKYKAPFESSYHSHVFFHYIYVLEGTGIIRINNIDYTGQCDSMFLIPSGTMHSISTFESHEFKTIEIKFQVENSEYDGILRSMPFSIRMSSCKIRYMLDTIICEATQKNNYFQLAITVKFSDVLLHLMRLASDSNKTDKMGLIIDSNPSSEGIGSSLHAVIKYIEDNVSENIQIDQLARIAHLSVPYFCTLFKEHYGVSPNKYINNIKLAKAKELMLYSDMNISKISESLGFASLHYFSKFFKMREGVSPSEYIAGVKNDIRISIADPNQSFLE